VSRFGFKKKSIFGQRQFQVNNMSFSQVIIAAAAASSPALAAAHSGT
jgi:hypothetical protein